MTDAAGLVLGVFTTWKACVQVFDIISSGRQYGMDYEIIRVKLEVERIRLLVWGDAVGLNEVQNGGPSRHALLNHAEVRQTLLGVLGCIEHIFENPERLQEHYGLRQEQHDASDQSGQVVHTIQTHFILGPVFKRAYAALRRSARDRQRSTAFTQKTFWAVHDRTKFQRMVTEIKGFNDDLANLFPDLRSKTSETLRSEIDESDEIRSLILLQQAAADEHGDIFETASVRLEMLGASMARSVLNNDARTVTQDIDPLLRPAEEAAQDAAGAEVSEHSSDPEMAELSKQMKAVEIFTRKKSEGALRCTLLGPYNCSAHVTASVAWDGREYPRDRLSYWDDRDKGFVKMSHASFGGSFHCSTRHSLHHNNLTGEGRRVQQQGNLAAEQCIGIG
jgi:hypothetical protein